MICRRAAILFALSLVAVAVSCGGSGGDPTAPSPTPAPAAATAYVAVPTATPHQPVDYSTIDRDHYGKATASLEERVYLADVVVRARLVSAASDVLTFTAIEYLKGGGPDTITVRASTTNRDTQWDDQDAILFLSPLDDESADFAFTDTTEWDYWESWGVPIDAPYNYTGDLPEGYHVRSRNPVWLPIDNSAGGAGGAWGQAQTDIIIEYDAEGSPETVSTAKLSGLISTLTLPSGSSGAGGASGSSAGRFTAEDVQNCIIIVVGTRRGTRDYAAYYGEPWQPPVGRFSIDSGQADSTAYRFDYGLDLNDAISGNQKYDRFGLSGPDAHLFNARVYDDDNDSLNGYTADVVTRRPLPAGVYGFKYHTYHHLFEPCGYDDESEVRDMIVAVHPPRGTIYEAFFDPATTTAGTGYATGATTTGVLKPTTFSVGGVSTTITGLKWQGGSVVLWLSPFVSLTDQQIEFIALTGTTTLVLRVSDATADRAAGTLTWTVADRPWSGGDQLMLRIRPAQDYPPAPQGVSLAVSDDAFTVSWNAVAATSGYRVEHRASGGEWASVTATTTSRTISPDGGVSCGHEFRVFAHGDGETHFAGWGPASQVVSHSSGACNRAPVFATSTYAFSIPEDTPAWEVVGAVAAADPNVGDFVTYHITAGNEGDVFQASAGNDVGHMVVRGALDYETRSSYTLTVEARDGKAGGTARATVVISVTGIAKGTPSAPRDVSVVLSGDAFTITWSAVSGVGRYRAQHRTGGSGDWTDLDAATSTSRTFSPEGGPVCETAYEFRVQAQGDGVTHVVAWGQPSAPVSHTTGPCNRPPVFATSTYAFSVAEDATTSTAVGAVAASDPDGDAVAYSITAGNDGGAFSIDGGSGSIAVASPLDYETTVSYTLAVRAADGNGSAATATVHISVTNVAEGTPSAPQGVVVSLADGTFTISWNAVSGAGRYRAQHRTGSSGDWTSLDATASTTQAFSPEGGVACGTTFEFRVQARGDGETHVVAWGEASAPVSHTAATCNLPPVFATSTYAFSVAENTAAWSVIGSVSATDPNEGDFVTYHITAGNAGGKFIASAGNDVGHILLRGALDYESVSSYTLTVEARDGNGGTARATVVITVTDVAD